VFGCEGHVLETCNTPVVQNTSTIAGIVETCHAFLQSHELIGEKWGKPFHFYFPSCDKYSMNQWLWDGSSHMISWSHLNVTNSILSMRTMLSMQQADGRCPEIILWGPSTVEGDALQLLMYSTLETVDLTQTPLIPFALRAIYNKTKDVSLLKEFLPKIVKYYDWWANTRAIDGDGLVSIIHGWESGLDASPLYDGPYGVTSPQPSYFELYPKFAELILAYHWEYGWNQTEILSRSRPPGPLNAYFIVQDVGVNAVYASGWGILSELAAYYDPVVSAYCKNKQQFVENTIVTKCWNSTLKRFISFYHDINGVRQEIDVEAVQSLLPIMIESITEEQQQSIINNQLLNPKKFWTNYPIPSVAADTPQFQPEFTVDLMWRGPTWPMMNWMVMEGLNRHGHFDVTKQLMDRWIALYQKSQVYEQYNPITGAPYGPVGLGMSSLIVDWIYRFGLI
jgi:hypothetical protein